MEAAVCEDHNVAAGGTVQEMPLQGPVSLAEETKMSLQPGLGGKDVAKGRQQDDLESKDKEEEERRCCSTRRNEPSTSTDPQHPIYQGKIAEGMEHLYRTNICPECRRCFKKRTHLLEHMRLHFPDPSLQCPTCQHYFTSKSKLRIHLLREAGQKPHRCPQCEYSSVERNSLRRHLASVHGGEGGDDGLALHKYPCPTCGETFHRSQALKAHMKTHNSNTAAGQKLSCFIGGCPFQCGDKRALQRHASEEHRVEAVECRYYACDAIFEDQEAMEAHHRTHLAFHCQNCSFSCSNKSSFRRHQRQGHPGEEELSCSFCAFVTFNPVQFAEHTSRLHANEKTNRCPHCSFVTAHKRVLSRHMLLHTGEKPHKCQLCDFRCRDETYLSKHMLTHSDDKNHMCSECGYITKWKHYLNVHMRKHAGDLRYQCDQCTYRCHRADQLSSHKLRHQEKSLICEVCAFSCKRKYELRRHMQLRHGASGSSQPSTFQCKYCPYTTQYRQALHNHENCKHTRHREFRCALCSYTTFSGTSLFLHKRKTHGYVPGDKAWLERYAEQERANSTGSRDKSESLSPVFANTRHSITMKLSEDQTNNQEPSEKDKQSDGTLRTPIKISLDNNDPTTPSVCEIQCIQGPLSKGVAQEKRLDTELVCQAVALNQSESFQEECCTLVLSPFIDTESIVPPCVRIENEDFVSKGKTLTTVSEKLSDQKLGQMAEEQKTNDVEEDNATVAECLQHCSGGLSPEACGKEGRELLNLSSKVSKTQSLLSSQSKLKLLRKQDKEQAEVLVLEGRVQMLVVQNRECTYKCDSCPYITHRQASLKLHHRSTCPGRYILLRCKDCNATFKQRRCLDTHRLRKCPVLGRNNGQRFPAITTNECKQAQLKKLNDNLPVNRKDQCVSKVGTKTGTKKGVDIQNPTLQPSNLEAFQMVEEKRYNEENGKFKCISCSFSSFRVTTIDRHSKMCGTKYSQRGIHPIVKFCKLLETTQAEHLVNPKGNSSEKKEGNDNTADEEIMENQSKKSRCRFSCHRCSFMCHQKRALDTHVKRGCLKPGELQCQHCSYVAKSQAALSRHVQAHVKKAAAPDDKSHKSHLKCSLCPFTCKQGRRLARHVALNHEGVRPYRCRFCGFSTTRRYRLEAHESLHTGTGRLVCDQCDRTFGTTSKLRLHVKRVHEGGPTHFCSLCDYTGYTANDVHRHRLTCHTGDPLHPCELCNVSFSTSAALKQHCRRQHRERATSSCPHCDFTCSASNDLKAHQEQAHPRLQCRTCRMSFSTRQALAEHKKVHLTEQCPECPFASQKKQLLAQHLLEEHEGSPLVDKPLKCSVCGFSCRHQLVLENHLRSHGGTRLYRCTDCQYSTRNRQKITWHIRIHTGEKPYHCELCSYACIDPSRLKYHMRTHQEERKYLCPECGYKCKWVNQLKYHMTRHTGAKPHECDECPYRTNRADALRIHKATRHGDTRAFICEKCGKGFKTRYLLRTHQRKHSEARPYVCRLCRRAFRWPAGLRHHFLTHTELLPFYCRHCSYRARQRFQVVRHLLRHHPDQSAEEGVARELGSHTISLQEACLQGEKTPKAQDGLEKGAAVQ